MNVPVVRQAVELVHLVEQSVNILNMKAGVRTSTCGPWTGVMLQIQYAQLVNSLARLATDVGGNGLHPSQPRQMLAFQRTVSIEALKSYHIVRDALKQ